MKKGADILQKLSNISTLPTLPTVVQKINSLLEDPQTSGEEIGKTIISDQALASKVLKLVNSAFYGFPRRVSTITHAVVILGFSTIKNIVLTASIFDAFDNKDSNGFNLDKFWIHSIGCGAASKVIAEHIGQKEIEEFFIAGLIHDIGKIVLCQYFPEEFEMILQNTKKKNILIYESEKELFNITHQEIGGFITKEWKLPENLQYAVSCHHKPSGKRKHYLLSAVVHCADILARAMEYGNGGDAKIPSVNEKAWKSLGLSKEVLSLILEKIDDEFEKASILMQV